jgi:outer membrane protein assembly factor BamB
LAFLAEQAESQNFFGNRPGQEAVNNVFLPAPRGLRQQLTRARRALQEERFGEAVDRLGQLLAAPELSLDGPNVASDQDYFLTNGAEPGTQISMKSEAEQLIGDMPPKGRELYELKYGADAQRLLDEALEQRAYEKLFEVTRRYFHTSAGYTATMLIGRQYLDQGRPLAAALAFQRLVDAPSAVTRFDPELSVLLATCWLFADMPDRAETTLVGLKSRNPSARLRVGTREIGLFEREELALTWLNEVIGAGFVTSAAEESEWTVHRGNAARNAETSAGLPLLHARWRVRTANHPTDEGLIRQKQTEYLDQNVAALPGLFPLAVRDIILMRTPKRLIAVDFDTGKRIWEFPWFDAPDKQTLRSDRSRPRSTVLSQKAIELQQRVWEDAAYGQISSNGRDVFLLWELGAADPTSRSVVIGAQGVVGPDPNQPREYNKLVALSLEGEGKLRWIVGGRDGTDEPRLAKAFFLGPPLPLMGHLYVLAEVNGEIRLVVLDADTGQLQWAQQLAHVGPRKILADPGRRLAGASPSYSNGVLICPTSAGAVVAVDVARRSLLWGYQYPQASSQSHIMVSPMRRSHKMTGYRWADSTVTIADGVVVLTPIESDNLICLDLVSGQPKWDPVTRNDLLYTAAIRHNRAVMVAKDRLECVGLNDGKTAWKLSLPAGLPSGRGVLSNDFYFLPTTAKRLLKIDIKEGELIKEIQTDLVLGNLLAYRDQIVSQGADWLSVYYQTEPLRAVVAKQLEQHPTDVWAMARRAELELYDGQRNKALATLRQAFELAPEDDGVRALLVASLLTALRDDFASNQDAATQLQDLIEQPSQLMEYYRLMARGLQQLGQFDRALAFYIKLTEFDEPGAFTASGTDEQLVEIDKKLQVRPDRWMRSQLASMLSDADGDVRRRIDETIKTHLAEVLKSNSPGTLRKYVNQFGAHPSAELAQLELARQLISRQQMLDAEMQLLALQSSNNREIAGQATATLAGLLLESGKLQEAAVCYGDLEQQFADVVCLEDRTGLQLAEEARQNPSIQEAIEQEVAWPVGKYEVQSSEAEPSRGFLSGTTFVPIERRSISGPIPAGTDLVYDQRMNAIVIRDQFGKVNQRVILGDQNKFSTSTPVFAHFVANGHLLLVSLGFEVVAVDMLGNNASQEDIIWRRDLSSSSSARSDRRRLSHRSVTRPWGPTRYVLQESTRLPLGMMGPLNENGLFCQKMRDLTCIDPLTGEVIWTRSEIPLGCDIFGDGDLLFVVPPDSAEAMVFRASDGTEVGKRYVHSQRERWFTIGRKIVACIESADELEMRCYDAWEQTELWKVKSGKEVKCCRVGTDEIAVMDPAGTIQIIRVADGSFAVDEKVEPVKELQQLYVQKSSQQYLVTANQLQANRPLPRSSTNVRVHNVMHPTHSPMVDGYMYAFDARTGKPMWERPAGIHKYCVPLDQPPESPVLALMRHVSVPTENSSRRLMTTTLLCIDKRDGREIITKEDLATVQTFEMVARPSDSTVFISLSSGTVTLRLTDDAIAPQPPVQTKDPTASLDTIGKKIAGAILDALGSGVAEAQKLEAAGGAEPPAPLAKPADAAENVEKEEPKETEQSEKKDIPDR